ncbi:MAG: sulfotransferase domain-containing protein [Jaaginema sp. PMC 1079.18]|nr:sulfotransferase domain-containing protein [Jaaginema sp. PMC 1080.18]MEC4853657.1 sulfotransferase domain-containing protein [Jaaginema sp. PMC 1079.18]MEC4868824.1 sulfotransferase domain-containing protein [Jaaginema sp. PMC 1078.18]
MNQIPKQVLIDYYRQALKINPNNYSLYDKVARLYYEIGEFNLAGQVCKAALQQNSDWELTILPSLLEKMGLADNNSQFLQYVYGTTSLKTQIASNSSMSVTEVFKLFEEDDPAKAIDTCFDLIQNHPILEWPHSLLNRQLIMRHNTADFLDKIIGFYESILQRPPILPTAYIVFGNALTQKGKIVEAITAFQAGMNQKIHFNKYHPQYYCNIPKRSQVDFLIIGIGKGGTSAVYQYLSQHPKILCPFQKELHFFNQKFELGIDWYLAQFPQLPQGSKYLTGEATPWYLASHGVAEKVYQAFPHIKLIALLRNPVTRAVSHYYMARKLGLEKRSLEVALNSELAILSQTSSFDEITAQYWSTERGYLWLGLYIHFIQKWLKLFPSEQLLILRSEDLYRHTDTTLQQIYHFLDIPEHSLKSYPRYNANSYPKISSELYQKLTTFFQPYNQKIESYLGRSFDWE